MDLDNSTNGLACKDKAVTEGYKNQNSTQHSRMLEQEELLLRNDKEVEIFEESVQDNLREKDILSDTERIQSVPDNLREKDILSDTERIHNESGDTIHTSEIEKDKNREEPVMENEMESEELGCHTIFEIKKQSNGICIVKREENNEESMSDHLREKIIQSQTEEVNNERDVTTHTIDIEEDGNGDQAMENNHVECEEPDHNIFDDSEKSNESSTVKTEENSELEENKKEIKCTYPDCHKTFFRPSRLKKHILYHENQRLFTCSMIDCGKSYITAQHLRRHHKIAHTDGETTKETGGVPCDEPTCAKTFQSKSSMSKHYKTAHLTVKPRYTCEECFACFSYCAEYYIHMEDEHGIRKIVCEICDITFTCQTDRTRHMRGHRTWICNDGDCKGLVFTNYLEKRKHDGILHPTIYICHHCNFRAQRKAYLEEHMYSKHLSEWDKPLLGCTYRGCNKTFLHERNYAQHYKKKHLHLVTLHDCPLGCPQTFASKQSAQRHVAKMHQKVDGEEEEKPFLPFPCDYCYKRFAKEHNVRRHILRMHASYPKPTIRNLVNSVYIKPGDKPSAPRHKKDSKKVKNKKSSVVVKEEIKPTVDELCSYNETE